MSDHDKNLSFDAVLQEALKEMQETASTTISSSYEVLRSDGEVIVRKADKGWSESQAPSQVKKAA